MTKDLPQSLREIFGLKQPAAAATVAVSSSEAEQSIARKTRAMQKAAAGLDFEKAAELRDEIQSLRMMLLK